MGVNFPKKSLRSGINTLKFNNNLWRRQECEVEEEASIELLVPRPRKLAHLLKGGRRDGRRDSVTFKIVQRFAQAGVKLTCLLRAVRVVNLEPLAPADQVRQLEADHQRPLVVPNHGVDGSHDPFEFRDFKCNFIVIFTAFVGRIDVNVDIRKAAKPCENMSKLFYSTR